MNIDVEGAELNVLRGAEETLTHNEDIKISIAAYHYPKECEEISKFLAQKGFNYWVYECDSETHIYSSRKNGTIRVNRTRLKRGELSQ